MEIFPPQARATTRGCRCLQSPGLPGSSSVDLYAMHVASLGRWQSPPPGAGVTMGGVERLENLSETPRARNCPLAPFGASLHQAFSPYLSPLSFFLVVSLCSCFEGFAKKIYIFFRVLYRVISFICEGLYYTCGYG